MKRIIIMVMAALFVCSMSYAQTQKETIRERRQVTQYSQSELNKRASKAARKEAKALKKEGWKVAPGQLPLEKQLDKSYNMYYEYDETGLPKYIIGDAMSSGATYDAASIQAMELAKMNLAGQIENEITVLTENTVANAQISADAAESIVRTVQASKNLIIQRLGRVFTVVECYRELKNTVQVRLTVAYDAKRAMDAAKSVIQRQLEEKGEDLHEQLDAIWAQL